MPENPGLASRLLKRVWKTLRVGFEPIEVAAYKASIGVDENAVGFKAAVKADLERRRNLHCPVPAALETPGVPAAES